MRRPAQILFTIPNFITAGSGREMINIIERLDRKYFTPSVCVMRKGGNLESELERLGVPLLEAPFVVPLTPLTTLPHRLWRAAKIFRPYGFQLWHSFHYSSDFTEPLIARLAGARAWIYTKKNISWGRRAWHIRSLLASRIVARNQTMIEQFFYQPRYSSKTRLIYGGADIHRFSPEVHGHQNLRAKLGVPPTDVVAACVAQIVEVKGHPTLLRAIAEVPGMQLWLVGKPLDESYFRKLKELAEELGVAGRIRFLGHIADIPALLAEADIFVLPTIAPGEGCPVALMEAMASGKCCVATDVSGSRDLIVHGKSGLLVEPGEHRVLAGTLRELMTAPEKRRFFGEQARKRAERCFTLEQESARFQALYQELIGAGG